MSDSEHLDRFDRMLLAAEASPAPVVIVSPQTGRQARRAGSERRSRGVAAGETAPYITSKRGSRFVDHTACPMCGIDGQGVEYHGTLMSGAKVHQLAAHTAGMRRVERGQPRCLGAGMRLVFEGGGWKGAPAS